jgi:hypothetical protein
VGLGSDRALQALLPAVDRGAARTFAAARGLGDAAVDGYLGQLQTDHAVVSLERESVDGLGDTLFAHSLSLRRMVRSEHPGLERRS